MIIQCFLTIIIVIIFLEEVIYMNLARIDRIIKHMEKNSLEQILITSTSSLYYILGKWIEPGERLCALYINTNGEFHLFINELFPIENIEGLHTHVFKDTDDSISLLSTVINKNKKIGIDKFWTAGFLMRLLDIMGNLELTNGSKIIDEIRVIKDKNEIDLMIKSSLINDKVISEFIKNFNAEKSEIDLCRDLLSYYEKQGAEDFSFSPLIAFGRNASEPHHSSDKTLVKAGDSIIFDIGGRKDYYCSDMTRTVFYKECSDKNREVYNIVLEANLNAISKIKPGVIFSDIDKAARSVIENYGYGEYFTHRTGHNIGIDVHEYPDVSSTNKDCVAEGMIFSIEPGIYLPNNTGVRIEDLVLVTRDGCEVLNKYKKDIQLV